MSGQNDFIHGRNELWQTHTPYPRGTFTSELGIGLHLASHTAPNILSFREMWGGRPTLPEMA
jgi:hypothetical protein